MGRIFDPQNSFWRGFGLVPDVLALSLMWVVFSLPVVTIGASTTALYDAVAHGIRFKEGGCAPRFWRTFKRELPLATGSWLLWAVIWGVCMFMLTSYANSAEPTEKSYMFVMAGRVLMLLPTGIICWIFPLLSRFTFSFGMLNRAAIAFAIGKLPRTLLLALSTAGAVYLCAWLWLPILFMPVALMYVWTLLIEKVFQKYIEESENAEE